MKNALLYILPALFLTSCTPLTLQYKEGQSVSRMSTDLAACEASADQQVPKDIRTRYLRPLYLPYGYYGPYGFFGNGRTESYDANQAKRKDVAYECMSAQGYTTFKIPACRAGVAAEVVRATPLQQTTILPPLTENSCIIRLKSGGFQIVNPS